MDLISSEAKPKISSALADFILASARISFLQEFEVVRENDKNIFFVAHKQQQKAPNRVPFAVGEKCIFLALALVLPKRVCYNTLV